MNQALKFLKSTAGFCLSALATLCLVTAAQAQTAAPAPAVPAMAAMPAQGASANMPMPMPMHTGKPQMGGMHKADKAASGSQAMRQSMMGGMDGMHKMKLSGDTDKDFATMMKMHHQGALNMAQFELDNGKSPEMKAMATAIIAAQKKEIAQFDGWLAKQK